MKNNIFFTAVDNFINQLAAAYTKDDFLKSIATLKTSIDDFNNGKRNAHLSNITLDDLYRRGLRDQHLIKIIIWTAEQDYDTTFGRLQELTHCFNIDWNKEVLDGFGNSRTPLNIAECHNAGYAAQFIRKMTGQEKHKSPSVDDGSDSDEIYDQVFEEGPLV